MSESIGIGDWSEARHLKPLVNPTGGLSIQNTYKRLKKTPYNLHKSKIFSNFTKGNTLQPM